MTFRYILCIVLLVVSEALTANNFSIKTVVIDAGHGGKDPGAIGGGKTFEKDVALAVALKLGERIQKNFPDVKVIYTRKTDVFLELHERAEIANKAKADLFIAIHCNSSTNTAVYGSSSYVLGLHKTEANLEVAKRENSVILLEDNREKNYSFNPNSPEGHIIMTITQNAYLEQSLHFASKVEDHMENTANRKSLGVKQAGFYVLYKTAMPGLLAEIGFISNPDEERFLNSEKGQDQLATALLKSFSDYKTAIEGSEVNTDASVSETKAADPVKSEVIEKPVVKTEIKKEPATEAKVEVKTEVKQPVKVVVEEVKTVPAIRQPVETGGGGGKTTATVTNIPKPEVTKTETVAVENKPVVTPKTTDVVVPKSETVAVFKIQLFSLRESLKDRERLEKLFNEVSSEPLSNGLTRYYGGKTKSYSEAKKYLQTAVANGFKDAYIVGFKEGKRLTYEQLKEFDNQ